MRSLCEKKTEPLISQSNKSNNYEQERNKCGKKNLNIKKEFILGKDIIIYDEKIGVWKLKQ